MYFLQSKIHFVKLIDLYQIKRIFNRIISASDVLDFMR
jgi:hypothetical protein